MRHSAERQEQDAIYDECLEMDRMKQFDAEMEEAIRMSEHLVLLEKQQYDAELKKVHSDTHRPYHFRFRCPEKTVTIFLNPDETWDNAIQVLLAHDVCESEENWTVREPTTNSICIAEGTGRTILTTIDGTIGDFYENCRAVRATFVLAYT